MTRLDNTGILGRNDKKDPKNPDHEKWADFKGDIMVDGKRYWLSAWVKESRKDGRKFFSLAFKKYVPKDAKTP